nr:hypothetical protein [Tanacetum cinerariifolium]
MDIEEEEPEEDPVEEPKPLAGHRDQFDAHPNPQPGNMNGWVDDHDDVQGDQTPPPGDESSNSEFEAEEADDELEVEEAGVEPEAEGVDVELEAEEPDGAPKATIGTGSQRQFAGESSTARDQQFIGGLALRRDLEALRRQDMIREAELGTSRTEIALLGSEARIGKMEREILHHDLSGVEETLGNVVERLKVLERGENTALRKKLADREMLLDLTQMVHKGEVPKPPSDEGSKLPRKMPKKSDGDEGPFDPRGPLMIMPPKPMSEARMREIIRDQFATSMNEFMANRNNVAGGSRGAGGSGGTGGNAGGGGNAVRTGIRGAGPTVLELTGCTYVTFTKCDLLPFNGTKGAVGLCQWFEKLESVFQIRRKLWVSKLPTIPLGVRTRGEVMQGNAGCMTNAAPNNNETCQKCKNKRHAGDCWKCTKCGKLGHQTERCRIPEMSCYNCIEKGRKKKDCPKLGRNRQGGNNRGGAYQLVVFRGIPRSSKDSYYF